MITDINYIKNIIENEYGITNPEAYIEYKKQKSKIGLTIDEINKLSPDTIDSGSFWEYVENHSVFNRDAIAYGCENSMDIKVVNLKNYDLACKLGTLNYLFAWHNHKFNFLDIGAGYGMLKDIINITTHFDYYGVDVCPKIEGIYKVEDCFLPKDIINLKFQLIISTNVFQHLSVRQRNIYYEQVYQILENSGIFSVSMINKDAVEGFKCNDNGKTYACHYGQYTELQGVGEMQNDLLQKFNIISICFSGHNITFHCAKKQDKN